MVGGSPNPGTPPPVKPRGAICILLLLWSAAGENKISCYLILEKELFQCFRIHPIDSWLVLGRDYNSCFLQLQELKKIYFVIFLLSLSFGKAILQFLRVLLSLLLTIVLTLGKNGNGLSRCTWLFLALLFSQTCVGV